MAGCMTSTEQLETPKARRQKIATPEQKAKAAERRTKMRAIAKQISGMSELQRAELVRDWPTTIEGHQLSMFNACMIALQGGATVVGGFRQWKRAGRSVMKGQHGLTIWVPLGKDKRDNGQSEQLSEDSPLRFILATVFDVSQTEEQESEVAA